LIIIVTYVVIRKEEAQKNGVVFAVMHQERALPQMRLARKIIESGRLGQIRRTCMIEPHYRSQAYYDSATWRAINALFLFKL